MARTTTRYSYPKFTIRLTEQELQEVKDWIDTLHRKINKGRDPKGERAITRSNIALTALKAGLELIEQHKLQPKPKGTAEE